MKKVTVKLGNRFKDVELYTIEEVLKMKGVVAFEKKICQQMYDENKENIAGFRIISEENCTIEFLEILNDEIQD